MSARLEHGDVGVGVDADLAGDGERLLHDLSSTELRVRGERASGRERIRAAGADGENAVVGLDELTGARDDEAVLRIGDGEQRLETPEHAVAAPILGELHGGTREVAGIP